MVVNRASNDGEECCAVLNRTVLFGVAAAVAVAVIVLASRSPWMDFQELSEAASEPRGCGQRSLSLEDNMGWLTASPQCSCLEDFGTWMRASPRHLLPMNTPCTGCSSTNKLPVC